MSGLSGARQGLGRTSSSFIVSEGKPIFWVTFRDIPYITPVCMNAIELYYFKNLKSMHKSSSVIFL